MRSLLYPRTEEELRADGFPEDAIKEVLSGEFDWATTGAIWRAGEQDLDDALQNMAVCNAALAEHDAILHDVEESMVEMKEQMEVIERRVLAKSEEVAFRESKTIATLQRDVLLLRKAHQAVEKAAEASIINEYRTSAIDEFRRSILVETRLFRRVSLGR
ncbi:hypothetical protein FA95DRAFT_1115624 [Auriscalpium vulgare]|uniref:Uncharacterized protein n=1 Tax=Auriscalpium vulgare TaxID=40419 RepID=A0ACB8R519_9AGAM|nr:hypothetical protein FA95DRAFT_1115624 [Auriscalpium vulgare]